jgi:uncharacterized DUF497 family protein
MDFVKAQALWNATTLFFRQGMTGKNDSWLSERSTGSFGPPLSCYRGAAIRIISVRKSTSREIATYEKISD